jgi:hypothetical protein
MPAPQRVGCRRGAKTHHQRDQSGPPTLLMGCALFGLGIGNLGRLPPIIAEAEFEPADIPGMSRW